MTKRTDAMQQQRRDKEPIRKKHRGESSQSRQPRQDASPPRPPSARHLMLRFTDPAHVERFNTLRAKPFEGCSYIDWAVLQSVDLDQEVRELISTGAWPILFDIRDEAYKELTLEVLSTFEIHGKQRGMDIPDLIQFRVMGELRQMSYTQFSIYMGLYAEEFVYTPEYSQLATRFPRDSPPLRYWRQISREHAYDPSRSKGSTLHSPALRVVHRLLAQTVNARRDSPGVVGE